MTTELDGGNMAGASRRRVRQSTASAAVAGASMAFLRARQDFGHQYAAVNGWAGGHIFPGSA